MLLIVGVVVVDKLERHTRACHCNTFNQCNNTNEHELKALKYFLVSQSVPA